MMVVVMVGGVEVLMRLRKGKMGGSGGFDFFQIYELL